MDASFPERFMTRQRRRKCPNCHQLYLPDPRNRWHQTHCSQPACQMARKALSQRRWRRSPNGRDYFKGSANVQRVQIWRKAHPGYARKAPKSSPPLQDVLPPQTPTTPDLAQDLNRFPLQDLSSTQGLLLIGLIANLTGSPLQEDIALTLQRLLLLGRQVGTPTMAARRGTPHAAQETRPVQASPAPDPRPVQLGRSPPGSG